MIFHLSTWNHKNFGYINNYCLKVKARAIHSKTKIATKKIEFLMRIYSYARRIIDRDAFRYIEKKRKVLTENNHNHWLNPTEKKMMKLTKIDTQFKLHNYQSLFIVSIYIVMYMMKQTTTTSIETTATTQSANKPNKRQVRFITITNVVIILFFK